MRVAFVSGHLDLTQEEFDREYTPKIESVHASGGSFVVGDASGADSMFQSYAAEHGLLVTVFHMFESPRNNVGNFPTVGGATSDKSRDEAMTMATTEDIAWVRPGRENSGTAKNLKRRSKQ